MTWLNHWFNLLSTLELWEWVYWVVLTFVTIKGFFEYPNILNRVEKEKYKTVE